MKEMTGEAYASSPEACPVVGIGASAGGLEAFTRLLLQLPEHTGMAYVIVQHLDPAHQSLLPDLLARATKMPVHEVTHGMTVEPDHVYVAPPAASLTLAQNTFVLQPLTQTHGQHLTIDRFFTSLARERKHLAIGVLLSGTASDGTLGLQAIKAGGGVTFAQDAHSASFPQMPQNAIAAGGVAYILSPQEIAGALTHVSHGTFLQEVRKPFSPQEETEEEQHFTSILKLVRARTGVDFLSYKPATLRRRLDHRLVVLHLDRLSHYLAYLHEHSLEVEALSQDLLIQVTSFFRDPAVFETLTRLAFPALIQGRAETAALRIWVPGCATGEEVYSLAICWLEFLQEHSLTLPLQFFATDINLKALAQARAGIYPAAALASVSSERRARFFTPVDRSSGSYRINQAIRERCVFALHNVAKDPPFSRLDLVSCRNVLIYLGEPLQQKVLQIFHYALRPQGFLLLGTSESVGSHSRLFHRVEERQKLYLKKAIEGVPLPNLAASEETAGWNTRGEGATRMAEEMSRAGDILQEADRVLLAHHTPASVVIDANLEILQVRGQTSLYLELAPGRATFNVLKMARESLRVGLRSAILTARKERRSVTKEGLHVPAFGKTSAVRLSVIPLKSAEPSFLVLFEEMPTRQEADPPVPPPGEQSGKSGKRAPFARRIAALEQEGVRTRAEAAALLEDRDVANEELQIANEEILASNEELQSMNEELGTSKEELQATNEELTTANQELQTRNEQIKAAQRYADAIVETVREPLLVLSEDLRVQRANTAFYQFFQVTPQETEGRHLEELGSGQWNIPRLRILLEQVLPTHHTLRDFEIEHVFPRIGKKTMLLNARRIVDEAEAANTHLILLAIEDITERREVERQKETLLGMVSHELKTPLTGALLHTGMIQYFLEQASVDAATPHVQKLEAQLDLLAHHIDDLLDATGMAAGALRFHPTAFAIDALMREAIEEMQQINPSRLLLLEGETGTDVVADRERTGQALTNLLSNAIKYAAETEPIRVSALVSEERVTVRVQDRGRGIPADQQARIFERFYRVSTPAAPGPPGLGLGLYLTAQLIEQQGGQIWVESIEGMGSTFSFTLPRKAAS